MNFDQLVQNILGEFMRVTGRWLIFNLLFSNESKLIKMSVRTNQIEYFLCDTLMIIKQNFREV